MTRASLRCIIFHDNRRRCLWLDIDFASAAEKRTVCYTKHPIGNDYVKPRHSDFSIRSDTDALSVTSDSYIHLASLTSRIADNPDITEDSLKQALRSKDDANNPVCRDLRAIGNTFTFTSVIMTLTEEPFLQITLGLPSQSDYKTIR